MNDCALAIRLRSTFPADPRHPTIRLAGARPPRADRSRHRASLRRDRAARAGSAPIDRLGGNARHSHQRDASLTSLISRSSRATSSRCGEQLPLPLRFLDTAERLIALRMRQRVLDFVRHVGGELLDRSMRANSAWAESESAVASVPTSSRRASSGAGTPPHLRGPRASPPPHRPAAGSAGRSSATVLGTAAPWEPRQAEQRQDGNAPTLFPPRVHRASGDDSRRWRSRSPVRLRHHNRLSLVRRMTAASGGFGRSC